MSSICFLLGLATLVSVAFAADPLAELPPCEADVEIQFFNAYIDIINLPPSCESKNLLDIGFILQDAVEEVDGLMPMYLEEKILSTSCPFPDTSAGGATHRYQLTGRGERCKNVSEARRTLLQTNSVCAMAEKIAILQQKVARAATNSHSILKRMKGRASNVAFENTDLGEVLQQAREGAQICNESSSLVAQAGSAAAKLCDSDNALRSSTESRTSQAEVEFEASKVAVWRAKEALVQTRQAQHEMDVLYYMQKKTSIREVQAADRQLQEKDTCSYAEDAKRDRDRADATLEEALTVLQEIETLAEQLGTEQAKQVFVEAQVELQECEEQTNEARFSANKAVDLCNTSISRRSPTYQLRKTKRNSEKGRSSADKTELRLSKLKEYQSDLQQDADVLLLRSNANPTDTPSESPSFRPTAYPSSSPTSDPTDSPSAAPTPAVTEAPFKSPTRAPSDAPTVAPTSSPTESPTGSFIDLTAAEPSSAPSSEFVKSLARPFERDYLNRIASNLGSSNRECQEVASAVQQKTLAEEALLVSDEVFDEITQLATSNGGNAEVDGLRVDAYLANLRIQDESAKASAAAQMASNLCDEGSNALMIQEVEAATKASEEARIALAELKATRDKMEEVVALIGFDPILSNLKPDTDDDAAITLLQHMGSVEMEIRHVDSQIQELSDTSSEAAAALENKRESLVTEEVEIGGVLTNGELQFKIGNSALKKDEYYHLLAPDFEKSPPTEYTSSSTETSTDASAFEGNTAISKEEWFKRFSDALVVGIPKRLKGFTSSAGGCISENAEVSVVVVITEISTLWEQFVPQQCSTAFLARDPLIRGPGRGQASETPSVTGNEPTAATQAPVPTPTQSPTVGTTSPPSAPPTAPPTVQPTIPPPITKTVPALQDAFVCGGSYADMTLGKSDPTRLAVKRSPGTDYYFRHSFLQFDLRAIQGSVSEAIISLKVCDSDKERQTVHDLLAIENSSWDENKITWNNMPAFGPIVSTETISLDTIVKRKFVAFDVTSFVNSLVASNEPFASFAILSDTDSVMIDYCSSESASSSDHPKLTVVYSPES